MRTPRLLALGLAGLLTVTVAATALAASPVASPKSATKTIVGTVLVADNEFDILQAAVIKAGFVDLLNGKDQYTVFAPTDGAFIALFRAVTGNSSLNEAGTIAAINAGAVDTLLGAGALADILKYHVVEGRRFSNSVLPKGGSHKTIDTALGQSFGVSATGHIMTSSGGSSTIVTANINCTNGVIHVINAVLVPDLD